MLTLTHEPYRAVVNAHGASLAELSHDGRDVLVPQDGQGTQPRFRGAVLAPWPNRVHDGQYEFGGHTHVLPINEPARGAALHGLVYDLDWRVDVHESDHVELTVPVEPRDGYPYALRLRIVYRLDGQGLSVTLQATNTGDRRAPYGCGFHPYFTSGDAPIDDARLQVDAARHLEVTPDRMVPTGIGEVTGTPYDFTQGRVIAQMRLDDAYTQVGRVGLRLASGRVAELWRDDALPWVQAYTPPSRDAVALEPCSCPEDAFRSGTDLAVLEPAETHQARWGITASPS